MTGISVLEREISKTDEREKAIAILTEKIRNQHLSFFEEAEEIQKLIENFGLTQEETALKLGRVQSTIANKLRLLRLTAEERETITQYSLTERHARALLRVASPEDRAVLLKKIIDEGLNVDRTEQLIEETMGTDKHRQKCRRHSDFFRSMTSFANTMNKAVENIKSAGIPAYSSEIKGDGYIEYIVRIPVK